MDFFDNGTVRQRKRVSPQSLKRLMFRSPETCRCLTGGSRKLEHYSISLRIRSSGLSLLFQAWPLGLVSVTQFNLLNRYAIFFLQIISDITI